MLRISLEKQKQELFKMRIFVNYHRISWSNLLHKTIIMSSKLMLNFFSFLIFWCISEFNNKWRRTTLKEKIDLKLNQME
jgi:hypothetical protein